ncbi:modulator of smoothened protein [Lethenteron reissneri]|uniref:modulator of smoothened protein n=1 Tax=Lethenteron reissneri TaxID=7753 RepID=UPI002AB6B6B1|nr:modulator of smoothened protein [Lethenteron reissneri]
MDRLTAVAGCLFVAADVFAVVSLVNPDWINTGTTPDAFTIGLARQCQTIRGRERACTPPRLPAEWLLALLMMVCGVALLTAACALLLLSRWRRDLAVHARWIAFAAMVLFCIAALIFPVGFYVEEVGGQPYKLPNNAQVGSSYVLFIVSIFFTIVGLLFAGKVCLPG